MPNSENSCGKTCGSEVHIQCVVCRRCVVSAVPSSPDCTTNASRPAARHKRKTGSRSQRPRREGIDGMVIQGGMGARPRTLGKARSSPLHATRVKTQSWWKSLKRPRFAPACKGFFTALSRTDYLELGLIPSFWLRTEVRRLKSGVWVRL